MKPVAAALLVLLAVGCRTGSPPAALTFGWNTEDLVEQTNRLTDALLQRDQAALDILLAPEYVFHYIDYPMRGTMQSVPVAPRGKWVLKMLEELRAAPMESSVIDARVYGDLGVVISHYRWAGSRHGVGFEQEGLVTDVWVRREGAWRLLAGHASLFCPSFELQPPGSASP